MENLGVDLEDIEKEPKETRVRIADWAEVAQFGTC
jgi:hypothetical protein